jgi:hypothetical protein
MALKARRGQITATVPVDYDQWVIGFAHDPASFSWWRRQDPDAATIIYKSLT